MLSAHEVEQFDQLGAVTIDAPFSTRQIEAAAAALDRLLVKGPEKGPEAGYRIQRTADFHDPELLDIFQHPFLEKTAQSALQTDEVNFFTAAIAKTFPEPHKPFSFWEHVDIKYRLMDLNSVPRRMICSCLLWLTDVTMERAPLMYRPGSHRLIAADMEQNPQYIDNPVPFDTLPRLPYANPHALLAKRGQMTVCTTAMIHGASSNIGDKDRKVIFMPFMPKPHPIRANMAIMAKMRRYQNELRELFRPERRHLLPEAVTAEAISS